MSTTTLVEQEHPVLSVIPTTALHGTVRLSMEGPGRQRRATVFFRLILAIPHFIYAGVLSLVAMFAVVAAWFAALATGRVPDGLQEFLMGVLRYLTRFYAYAEFLLTDRYPDFSLDTPRGFPPAFPDYSVELELDPPGRLNRAAVLFRIVLIAPVAVAVQVIGYGLIPVLVVTWLVVLVSGRMPTSLFTALSSILRYEMRVFAFAAMMTSEYPGGLFGDRRAALVGAPAGSPADASPASTPPASPDPMGAGETAALTTPPRITQLALSGAAKRIVMLTVILGVVTWGASQVALAAPNRDRADELTAYYVELNVSFSEWVEDLQGCAARGDQQCLQDAHLTLADALREFQSSLRSMELPIKAQEAGRRVDEDVSQMASYLESLATAVGDPERSTRLAEQLGVVAIQFDRDYSTFYNLVSSEL